MTTITHTLEHDWAQLGVLFNCKPSGESPDLERLLLDTARACPENGRLLPLVVTWLAEYGGFVARHRLKRLVISELDPDAQAVLGLILDEAVRHGAPRGLRIVTRVCAPREVGAPLSASRREKPSFAALGERRASDLSKRWGVWTQPVETKPDALRPVSWLLSQNPTYRGRILRKGDLRVSVLETLRWDVPHRVADSESSLAMLVGATRAALRKALGSLTLEGEVLVAAIEGNRRDHQIRLLAA